MPGDKVINSGGSCVINPQGEIVAGPVEDIEEIIYAEVDLKLVHLGINKCTVMQRGLCPYKSI